MVYINGRILFSYKYITPYSEMCMCILQTPVEYFLNVFKIHIRNLSKISIRITYLNIS